VVFVLIQRGQGATAGAAFGSGASGTVFGARGAGNFLTRTTWVLAALFCAISLSMAVMVSRLSVAPEDDLGVVGSTQVAPAVEETIAPTEVSVTSDQPVVTDIPSFETAADDLPAADSMAGEEIDSTITEDAGVAEDGEDSTGSGSDDKDPG
jgi:preprotein translocase subunit SecG